MMQLDRKYIVLTASPSVLYYNFKGTVLWIKHAYKPYTLVGPTVRSLVHGPLAVTLLAGDITYTSKDLS